MGGYARQHECDCRGARRSRPGAARTREPAPVVRYQSRARTPKGNGEMVRTARRVDRAPGACRPPAGNGMRMIYMPPKKSSRRALPDQPAGSRRRTHRSMPRRSSRVIELDDAPSEQDARAAAPVETNAAPAGAATAAQSAQPTDARKEAKAAGRRGELEDEAARQEAAAAESEAEDEAEADRGIRGHRARRAIRAECRERRRAAEKVEADERAPNPRVIVQRWQGGVSRAGGGMSRPSMAGVAGRPGACHAARPTRRIPIAARRPRASRPTPLRTCPRHRSFPSRRRLRRAIRLANTPRHSVGIEQDAHRMPSCRSCRSPRCTKSLRAARRSAATSRTSATRRSLTSCSSSS